MFNYYVFDMTKRDGYTLIETANREYALLQGIHPDRVAFSSPRMALAWLNKAAEHFEPQALLEYRSLLEEAADTVEGIDCDFELELARLSNVSAAVNAEEEDEKAEQADETEAPEPVVLSSDASELMRDGLKHAADHILFMLKGELPSSVSSSTEVWKLVDRLDAYRLALLSLAGSLETAEIDAACRED